MEFELRFETARQAIALPDAATENTLKLLVLEDDAVARTITEDFLLQRGHEVFCVATAKEAIAAIKEQEFDALLSDINLPDMSGLELIQHIRLQPVEYRNIYAAALTASVLPDQESEFLNAGFRQVLTKPLDHQQLNQFFHEFAQSTKIKAPLPLVNEHFIVSEIATIGEEVFTELLIAYKTDFASQIEKLRQQDIKLDQQKTLHRLGSAASNLGLVRLQQHYNILEDRIKSDASLELDINEIISLNESSLTTFEDKIGALLMDNAPI